MNKLFTKIAALALGAAMAFGVGVAVSSKANDVKSAEASSGTYTKISATSDLSTGDKVILATDSNGTPSEGVTGGNTSGNNRDALHNSTEANWVEYQVTTSGSGWTLKDATANKFISCSSNYFAYQNSGSTFYTDSHGYLLTAASSGRFLGINGSNSRFYAQSNLNNYPPFYVWKISSAKTLSKIELSGTYPTTFFTGDTFTHTGMVVTATYDDKTTSVVTASASWSSPNMASAGTPTVTVSYTEGGTTKTASYTITVTARTLTSITLSGQTTEFQQNSSFSFDGTVTAHYSNAQDRTVTPTSVTSPDMTTTGTKSITVSYTESGVTQTASYTITVVEKQNLGGLVSGEKYFIIANGRYLGAFDSAPGAPAGTSKAWPGDDNVPTSDDDAWLFTATATDDNWIITSKAGNTLYATATNNGLGCTSTGNDNWTVSNTANGLKITAKNGRYLTQYGQSNFRVYTSTTGQTEADSTVRFVKYVAPATIESVEFTGSMTKTAYYVGDSWDYAGLSLQANLSDSTTEDLGTVPSLIQSGDLEIEATPTSPALNVTSVTLLAYYGQDLLEAELEITGITVSTPRTLEDVTLDGDMETKTYTEGDSWSVSGLYLTLTYDTGLPDTVQLSSLTKDTDYIFDHDTAVAGDTEIDITGEYEGFEFNKTVTGIVVSAIPGVINFGTTTGYWQPSATGSTFIDNKGNTATITSDSTAWGTRGPTYQQIGSNASAASYVHISIPLSSKSGIDAVSVTFSSSGANSVSLSVYGDTVDDVIVNGSASDSTNVTVSTGAGYEKINASTLNFEFEPTKGIKLTSISYTLGSTVKDFGTLASIAVSSSSLHNTTFEVDHTFSTEGLIITATDTDGFTKDFTTGFSTDYDGVTFDETAEDLEVTVTMTLEGVTRTTSYYIDVIEIPSYTLASSQSDLYEGMSVLIAYVEDSDVFTAGALSGSYLTKVNGSKDGDDIRAGEGSYEFVVEYYGSNILLRHGANYLKHTGDKSVSLASQIDASCVWSYDGESLSNVENDTYFLQYNKSSPRFTDYTGSQQDVGLYISSATPKDDTMGAATFAAKYLHMRDYDPELHEGVAGASYCSDSTNHFYSTAKAFYNSASFSTEEKVEFAKLTDAVKRLQAWASANGETFDPVNKTFNSVNVNPLSLLTNNSGTEVAIIVVTSMIGLSAVGGYFFLRKRKENI